DLAVFSMDGDGALIGLDQPDEDLHQRRLARPVLTEDAVDAPRVQREVDTIAGDHRSVALGDAFEAHRSTGRTTGRSTGGFGAGSVAQDEYASAFTLPNASARSPEAILS